jgi:hypothetical protein
VSGCPRLPKSFSTNIFSGRYSEPLKFGKEAVNYEGFALVSMFPYNANPLLSYFALLKIFNPSNARGMRDGVSKAGIIKL